MNLLRVWMLILVVAALLAAGCHRGGRDSDDGGGSGSDDSGGSGGGGGGKSSGGGGSPPPTPPPETPPTVTLLSPNGGESWIVGSSQTVTWSSSTASGTVTLSYATDGLTFVTLAAGTANDGSQSVVVPDDVSSTVRVRVSLDLSSAFDVSDADFSIIPDLVLTSPNGGEAWLVGSSQVVTWTVSTPSSPVDIHYTKDGITYTALATATPNDGVQSIVVPVDPSSTVRLRVTETATGQVDESDADLSFVAAPASSSGLLDPGFGPGGPQLTNPAGSDDRPRAIAVDSSWIYLAGYETPAGASVWRLEKRSLASGELDPSFGDDGVVRSALVSGNGAALALVLDGGSMYVAGYDFEPGNYQWRVEKRSTATGSLETSFDGDGILQDNPSTSGDFLYGIAVDATSIYLAGSAGVAPGDDQWRIVKRDKTTGAAVAAFDGDGVVVSNPDPGGDRAFSIVLSGTSMFVGGYDSGTAYTQWRVEKRDLTTGALDGGFDGDGVLAFDPGPGLDEIADLATDGSSLYLVGTQSAAGSPTFWRIECRSLSTGAPIVAFDGDGVATFGAAGSNYPSAVVVDGSFLYLAGSENETAYSWRVEKRDKLTGAYDTAFNGTGFLTIELGPGSESATDLAVGSSWLFVTGYDKPAGLTGNESWKTVKRSLATAAEDPLFGKGVIRVDASFDLDSFAAIATDSASMYLGGYDSAPFNLEWRLEKRSLSDGALVTAFDGDGIVTVNPSSGADEIRALAADSTSLYVAGVESTGGNSWRIEKRDLATGALDVGFDGDGVVVSDPSAGDDQVYAILVDATSIYVCGYDSAPGNAQWRIEKRSKTTGALDAGFGVGGVVQVNPSSGSDAILDAAIDASFLYLAGRDSAAGGGQWRLEKRSLASGGLDAGFDGDGVITVDPGAGSDAANAIVVDAASLYVAGRDSAPGNNQWRIEKRSLATGAPVTAFDGDGVVLSNPDTGSDEPLALAVDGAALYVCGTQQNTVTTLIQSGMRTEKRDILSGAPDVSFHANGSIHWDPSNFHDVLQGIAVDASHIYLVGHDFLPGNFEARIEKRLK